MELLRRLQEQPCLREQSISNKLMQNVVFPEEKTTTAIHTDAIWGCSRVGFKTAKGMKQNPGVSSSFSSSFH